VRVPGAPAESGTRSSNEVTRTGGNDPEGWVDVLGLSSDDIKTAVTPAWAARDASLVEVAATDLDAASSAALVVMFFHVLRRRQFHHSVKGPYIVYYSESSPASHCSCLVAHHL